MIATNYSRFSPRPDAATSDSLEKQVERLAEYVVASNYQPGSTFSDAGEDAAGVRHGASGGRADNRPGLQAALDEVCRNKGVLCVTAIDRLARNTKDAIDIVELLEKHGAALAILDMRLDTTNPMHRMFYEWMASFAQFYRKDIAAKTKRAMQKHVANGRRMGRADRIPYGKRLASSPCPACGKQPAAGKRHSTSGAVAELCQHDCHVKLLCHENEQVTLQAIMARHRRGEGPGTIAAALRNAGSHCRGKPWRHETIKRIIRQQMGK